MVAPCFQAMKWYRSEVLFLIFDQSIPHRVSSRVLLGGTRIPAPASPNSGAESTTVTLWPSWDRARADARPPRPAPTVSPPNEKSAKSEKGKEWVAQDPRMSLLRTDNDVERVLSSRHDVWTGHEVWRIRNRCSWTTADSLFL
jgi:hypothetical protein